MHHGRVELELDGRGRIKKCGQCRQCCSVAVVAVVMSEGSGLRSELLSSARTFSRRVTLAGFARTPKSLRLEVGRPRPPPWELPKLLRLPSPAGEGRRA